MQTGWVVGVCGASRGLSPAAVACCKAIGRLLAQSPGIVIASGGTKFAKPKATGESNWDARVGSTADWLIVESASKHIPPNEHARRFITFAVDLESESTRTFNIGVRREAFGRTPESRRFSFVNGVDALISIAGSGGTEQELALAAERRIPVLPLPMFGGASGRFWSDYRDEMESRLGLVDLNFDPDCDAPRAEKVCAEMLGAFLAALPRHVFVAMPYGDSATRPGFDAIYEEIIQIAVEGMGDRPDRTDLGTGTGRIHHLIESSIRQCHYVIPLLDGHNQNVMYEVGFSHALNKPTILIRSRSEMGRPLPFDISADLCREIDLTDRLGSIACIQRVIRAMRSS